MANEGTEYEPGKLFVGGLSWETTKENLREYFTQFGDISDSTIMVDRTTGKPRGFGFVTFTNPDHADAALQHPGPHMIDSKTVDPKRATKSGQSTADPPQETMSKPLKVFLGGLPSDALVDDIRTALKKFGPISASADAIDIKMDPNTNRSRGFGFVTFETEDAAQAACKEHYVYLGPKQVEVKKAEDQKSKGGKNFPQGYGGTSRMYGSGGYPTPGAYSQMTTHQQQQAGGYGYGSGAAGYPAAAYQQPQWSGYGDYGGSAGSTGYYPQPQGSNPASSYNGGAYASTGGYNSSRTDSTGAYASAVPQAQGYNYSQTQQPQQPLYNYGQQQQSYTARSQEQQGGYNGFPSRQ